MASTAPPSRPPSRTSNSTPMIPTMGYFSSSFERFKESDAFVDWASAFTLLDTVETFFDARIDLLERRFKKHSDRLKLKAEEALKRAKTPAGELINTKDFEKEVQKYKIKVAERLQSLMTAWESTKVVQTREKISFFFGVMNVLSAALLLGMAPQWIHIVYTLQALYMLPVRAYTYKKKSWHYFLFDLCYYANVLNLVYLWLCPSSPTLFVACYCLSHGSLASAVITWRNSLVFHDADKVTSLFIHIYPPFVFTTIRHFYPNAVERFPALAELPHLQPLRALLFSGIIYLIWQCLYWKFILVDRRQKIESGQRTTSFSFLLNDKRGFIGRTLASVPPQYRELFFMTGQLVYAILTELPAVFLLYDSAIWSGAFLLCIFSVSVWNGGTFYIEVFGRKFEKQLEALRKELAEANAAASRTSTTSSGRTSPIHSDDEAFSVEGSPQVIVHDHMPPSVDRLSLDSPQDVHASPVISPQDKKIQ